MKIISLREYVICEYMIGDMVIRIHVCKLYNLALGIRIPTIFFLQSSFLISNFWVKTLKRVLNYKSL